MQIGRMSIDGELQVRLGEDRALRGQETEVTLASFYSLKHRTLSIFGFLKSLEKLLNCGQS